MSLTPDIIVAVCAVVGVLLSIRQSITSRLQRIEEILTGLRTDTVTHTVCQTRRKECPCSKGVEDHEERLRALELKKGLTAT